MRSCAQAEIDRWATNSRSNLKNGTTRYKAIANHRRVVRMHASGAMAVIGWAIRKGPPPGSWLAKMLARKPRMLEATALANKLARTAWALTTTKENYRIPPLAAYASHRALE